MVYRDTTTKHRIGTSVLFRGWVQGIHKALEEVGLVQTSDTGQINTETVENPGSTNTEAGYEIWRFNDVRQATAPVYFKIAYGAGANVNRARLWVTVGTGSDGSGTITGTKTINNSGLNNMTMSFTPSESMTGIIHCAHDADVLLVYLNGENEASESSFNAYGFAIERLRDPTTKAIVGENATCLVAWSGSPAHKSMTTELAAGEFTGFTSNGGTLISQEATAKIGSDIYLGVLYPSVKKVFAPLVSVLGAKEADVATGEEEEVVIGGKTRNYLAIRTTSGFIGVTGVRYILLNE